MGAPAAFAHRIPTREASSRVNLPSAEVEPERYRGRPILAVVENYILAAIGEVPADDQEMRTIVRNVFGGGDDWMATIRHVFDLRDSIEGNLRVMWAKNREMARAQGVTLHPVQFAKMVADENFAPFIAARQQ